MISANRFWLSVHHLWRDYMEEGDNPEQRRTAVVDNFRALSPVAQRELIAELVPLVDSLANICLSIRFAAQPDGPPKST